MVFPESIINVGAVVLADFNTKANLSAVLEVPRYQPEPFAKHPTMKFCRSDDCSLTHIDTVSSVVGRPEQSFRKVKLWRSSPGNVATRSGTGRSFAVANVTRLVETALKDEML
jgi:hypothetical protein